MVAYSVGLLRVGREAAAAARQHGGPHLDMGRWRGHRRGPGGPLAIISLERGFGCRAWRVGKFGGEQLAALIENGDLVEREVRDSRGDQSLDSRNSLRIDVDARSRRQRDRSTRFTRGRPE